MVNARTFPLLFYWCNMTFPNDRRKRLHEMLDEVVDFLVMAEEKKEVSKEAREAAFMQMSRLFGEVGGHVTTHHRRYGFRATITCVL